MLKPSKTPTISSLLKGIICLLSSGTAFAFSFGNASTTSAIGEPLRIEIAIQTKHTLPPDTSCIHLTTNPSRYNDGVPWLSQANFIFEKRADNWWLIINSHRNNHPTIRVGIKIECEFNLSRDFILLLDPPSGESLADKTKTYSRLSTEAERQKEPVLYPQTKQSKHSERIAPYGKLLRTTQPSLPAYHSNISSSPNNNSKRQRNRVFVSSESDEFLSLQLSRTLSQESEENKTQRALMHQELALISILDEKIASQVELSDKLRQLEALQDRLETAASGLVYDLKITQNNLSPDTTYKHTAAHTPLSVDTEKNSKWMHILVISLGTICCIFGGALAFMWRALRKTQIQNRPNTLANDESNNAEQILSGPLIAPLTKADIWPETEDTDPSSTQPRPAPRLTTITRLGPPSLLQITSEDKDEHESAVELADVMMTFGRTHSAAQTLSNFIRSEPRQAVKPWTKLLEVYRTAGMRTEYEALSLQLNKTFNVKPIAWDDYETIQTSTETIEDIPHAIIKIKALWGTNDCQIYLHDLLRDNRQGTRQGFSLTLVDEILMLLGVLESYLGPYKPRVTTGDLTATRQLLQSEHILNDSNTGKTVGFGTDSQNPTPKPCTTETQDTSQRIDLKLEMHNLSKTLHLNLDDLNEDGELQKPAS